MSDASETRRSLVGTRWVHVDGDDTDCGAVYRDAAGDVPLSRRPKEYLEFGDDGTVRRSTTGPDDRARELDRASWREEDGQITFRFVMPDARGNRTYRIVEHGAGRLVIRRD